MLKLGDAITALDSGEIPDRRPHRLPSRWERTGLSRRAGRPDLRPAAAPGEPPAWLLAQADVIAEATVQKLKPLIRVEVRAALKAEARKQPREPSK